MCPSKRNRDTEINTGRRPRGDGGRYWAYIDKSKAAKDCWQPAEMRRHSFLETSEGMRLHEHLSFGLGLQNCEKVNVCFLKLPRLWYCVTPALGNYYSHRVPCLTADYGPALPPGRSFCFGGRECVFSGEPFLSLTDKVIFNFSL